MAESLTGKLLVAAPSVDDEQFARTVVFVIQHSDDGTFGVILNRPAGKQLQTVWRNLTGTRGLIPDRFSLGGPMGGPIFALHQSEDFSEVSISNDIFLSVEAKKLAKLSHQASDPYRIFVGMVGWEVGQIESELAQGKWYTLIAESQQIFGDTEILWEKSVRHYGQQAWCDLLGQFDWPSSAELN